MYVKDKDLKEPPFNEEVVTILAVDHIYYDVKLKQEVKITNIHDDTQVVSCVLVDSPRVMRGASFTNLKYCGKSPISQLNEGDSVLYENAQGKPAPAAIKKIWRDGSIELWIPHGENGKRTHNKKFFSHQLQKWTE
jgi:hypothetical protein